MKVFEFTDYKDFVLKKLSLLPNKGHGQFSKIAKALNIHTSLVSQIFQGDKNLSFEQACDLCSFFGFTELESDYLVALVLKARAGSIKARLKCDRDLAQLKEKSQSLKNRISKDITLSDADNAMFFSHWYYSAIKIIVSIPGKSIPEQIAREFNISLVQVNKVLEFLVQAGLLHHDGKKYSQGPSKLHLDTDSPFVSRHHLNWRVKAIEKIGQFKDDDFCFTMPANISLKDAKKIRQSLIELVSQSVSTIDNSKVEAMYCLNIDWFKMTSD
jgi:uncharacterized protein (TIGR02147 family)